MTYKLYECPYRLLLLGLSDVYQIGMGQCLQWEIVMDDDIDVFFKHDIG